MTVDLSRSYPLPETIDRHGNHIWLQGERVTKSEVMAVMTHWNNDLDINYAALLYLLRQDLNHCRVEIVETLRKETHGQDGDVFMNFMSLMAVQGISKSGVVPVLECPGTWTFALSRAGRRWFRSLS